MTVALSKARWRLHTNPGNEDYKKIYEAYATARWHYGIWRILRASDGEGAGQAFGAQIDGQWLDTGATQNVVDYYTRSTMIGKILSAVFGFIFPLQSLGPPGHSLGSYVAEGPAYHIHPDALRSASHIELASTIAGEVIVDERTALHSSHLPFPFHLYSNSVITEGAVRAQSGEKPVSFVVHSLYNADANPNAKRKSGEGDDDYFGSSLKEWLRNQGVLSPDEASLDKIWPQTTNAGDRTLFRAKIFPGISVQLLEAARHQEPNLSDFKFDDLDWELFQAMGEIWEWLQHKAQGPPAAWTKALEQGRLFSMSDHYDRSNPNNYELRQKSTAEVLRKALEHRSRFKSPNIAHGPWITGTRPNGLVAHKSRKMSSILSVFTAGALLVFLAYPVNLMRTLIHSSRRSRAVPLHTAA